MRLGNEKVQIIPFEPVVHAAYFYQWQMLGKYSDFFGNLELTSLEDWRKLKNGYMIVDPKDTSKVFGAFLLHNIDQKNRNIVINLLVDERFQKKGIGSQAGKFMLWYIFNTMNFYKVIGRCSENGIGTQKIFNRLGFSKEAHLKDHVIFEGNRKDVLQFYTKKGPFNKLFGDEIRSVKKEVVAAA